MLSRDCIEIIFPLSLLTTQRILRHNAGNNMFSGAKSFPPTCFCTSNTTSVQLFLFFFVNDPVYMLGVVMPPLVENGSS